MREHSMLLHLAYSASEAIVATATTSTTTEAAVNS